MRTFTFKELDNIFENHMLYLRKGKSNARANFNYSDLHGVDFSNLNLSNVDFANSNLIGAEFNGTILISANFNEADLRGASFRGANLLNASFINANLRNAFFNYANFSNANLSNANINGVDLEDTYGNLREIKSIAIEDYIITYTDKVMQIGCEHHLIEEWFNFSDKEIIYMDAKKGLKFWRKWKPILKQIMEIE